MLREVSTALHADSRRLALMGARTLVDMYINEQLPVTITLGATTQMPTITMDFAGIKQGSDLNGDGHTDISDIEIFCSKWLTTDLDANFDQQGLVELSDFARLAQLWMYQATWYNEIVQ